MMSAARTINHFSRSAALNLAIHIKIAQFSEPDSLMQKPLPKSPDIHAMSASERSLAFRA
jgi:hypothetical protein